MFKKAQPEQHSGGTREVVPARVKRRRSPAVIVAALLVIVMSSLGFYWLYSSSGERVSAVAVSRDIEFGQQITAEDVVATQIAVEPGLEYVPWASRDEVIGSTAVTMIPAKTLVSRAQTIAEPVPASGMSLVGVVVAAGSWPEGQLRAGDRLSVLTASGGAAGGAGGGAVVDPNQRAVDAVLVDMVVSQSTGDTTLVVQCAAADAATLAAYSASGNAVVIVNGPS